MQLPRPDKDSTRWNQLLEVLSRGKLFAWTRRLSGPIQFWIVSLFWMLPGSWVIRRYVDYAFDRSLQRKREISSFFQSESVILKSNPTREELLGEFHKFDEGIRELRRSSYVEGYFLDSVTLNMKRLD